MTQTGRSSGERCESFADDACSACWTSSRMTPPGRHATVDAVGSATGAPPLSAANFLFDR